MINTLFFLGYANSLHAGECGVLRYLANKSNGVAVTGNTCKTGDDIALGSEFNLMPGARLWFKSIGTEAKKTQGICQNRSDKPIRISVDSGTQPWIKPSGLATCGSWANNKMNCENTTGGQNALSCVIASIDSEQRPQGLEERTTSVRMRTLELDKPESDEEAEKERIISAMQPEVSLCRAIDPTNFPIKVTWLVEANGRVNTITPAINGSGAPNHADKLFLDCLTAVIKGFPYPQSSQAIWLSNQF